jgi:peptide chain release factor subunit 1
MGKSTTSLATPLRQQIERLAALGPAEAPVLSLYLDLRADQHGRDSYSTFLKKTFHERSRALSSDLRRSFDRDVERINGYLEEQVSPSANGLAVFTCSDHDFFEAVQLDALTQGHWLFIGSVPHLYPLARVIDQFPRYAALLANTNSARLFVFSLGASEGEQQVTNTKTKRTAVGGWSQARYQRHVENFHLHHLKEAADVLDRVVRHQELDRIVVSCDDSTRSTLLAQLPKHLHDKIVNTVHLGMTTPAHEVLAQTHQAVRAQDATVDAERVKTMLDARQARGPAVAGPGETMDALAKQQVEELLITASPGSVGDSFALASVPVSRHVHLDTSQPSDGIDPRRLALADELVAHAYRRGARVRFVEDPNLLAKVGGVGALLRFSIEPAGTRTAGSR